MLEPHQTPPTDSPAFSWHRPAVRAAALLTAMAMSAVHYMVFHVGHHPPTPFRWIVGILAVAAAATCLAIALAPAAFIDWLWRQGRAAARSLDEPPPYEARRWGSALLFWGWGCYLLLLAVYLSTPNDPNVGDQGTYLATAQWINAHGGLAGLPWQMLSGNYPEANRHPLFIALLSLMPTFTGGRLLAAGLGIVTLALLGLMIARRYGVLSAGIVTLLVGTNKLFLLSTSRVVCESLLALLCVCLWWRTVGDRRAMTDLPPRAPSSPSLVRAAELGALTGLVWLTKGTGLLILAAMILWWVCRSWPDRTRMVAGVALMGMAFGVTSSLLIARNVVRYGEPFYNVNTLLLFSDEYEQMDQMLAEGVMPREAARRYLQTHSLGDLLHRGITGVIWEKFILLRSLGPAPWGDGRVVAGTLWGVLAMGVILFRREWRCSALLAWMVILVPMFGWYVPIAAGDRFVVPLVLPLLASAGVAVSVGMQALSLRIAQRPMANWICGGMCLWGAVAVVTAVLIGPNEFSPG